MVEMARSDRSCPRRDRGRGYFVATSNVFFQAMILPKISRALRR